MTPVTRAFAANTRRLRGGLTQAELAAKAGVSPATVNSAERGTCGLRFEHAVRITRALGVTVDEMLTEPAA